MILTVTRNTTLHSRVGSIVAVLLLSACAPVGFETLQQDLTRAAQEQVLKSLSGYYTNELGKGVSTVVAGLAEPGGYLDNPVARILLPPPLGLALGVMRDLNADPQAALLSVLINQAAEQAIPGAAPILLAALKQITPTEVIQLLDGDKTAGSEALKARTGTLLQEVVGPLISDHLATSGALLVYKEMIESYRTPSEVTEIATQPEPVETIIEPVQNLRQYVTEQAIAGLFNVLSGQEETIRNNLGYMTGVRLPGMN